MEPATKGKLIIICGPTASGKDAIMHRLLKLHPDYERIVTTTTREPRDLERDGIDYTFTSQEEFKSKENKGDFLEVNEYAENFYGTPKSEFQKVLDGKTIIWRVDPTMAGRAKEFFKSAFNGEKGEELSKRTLVIYINSEPLVIKERIKERGMDSDEIERRLAQDTKNWDDCKDKFDFIIDNEDGKLDETVNKITAIIEAH